VSEKAVTETPQAEEGREGHEGRKCQPSEPERRKRDPERLDELEMGIQDRRPRARIWKGSWRWWLFAFVAAVLVLQVLFPQYMFRRYHPGDSIVIPIGFEILALLAAIAVGYFMLGRRSGF